MAYKIVINVENEEDLSYACMKVSNLIDEGYFVGMIGYSGDTWEVMSQE